MSALVLREEATRILAELCAASKGGAHQAIENLDLLFHFHAAEYLSIVANRGTENFSELSEKYALLENLFIDYLRETIVIPSLPLLGIKQETLCSIDALPVSAASLLLYIQRKICISLFESDAVVYDALICRKPSLGFSFSYLFQNDGSVTTGAVEYFRSLARVMQRALSGATAENAWPKYCEFSCAIRSPVRDFIEMGYFAEGNAITASGKKRGQPQRISEMLHKQTIRLFFLRPEQYQPINLGTGKPVPPLLSESDVELLTVLHACKNSKQFFLRLPDLLLPHAPDLAPEVAAAIREQAAKEQVLRVLEFPSFQQKDMVSLTIDNIRHTLLHRGPHAEDELKKIQRDYLECIFTFHDLLEAESFLSIWDMERYKSLVPYLSRLKLLRPWDRRELTSEIRSCEEKLRGVQTSFHGTADLLKDIRRMLDSENPEGEEARRIFGGTHIPSRFERNISEILYELYATITVSSPGDDEHKDARGKELVNIAIDAIRECLNMNRVRDPGYDLELLDPIPASVFDVPDHTSGPALHIKEVLKTNGHHQVKKDRAYHNYLFDVAAISLGMDEGRTKEQLRERHPDALVEAVHLRDSMFTKNVPKELLKEQDPANSMIVELLDERNKIDEYASGHVTNLAQIYFATVRQFQMQLGGISTIDRMIVRCVLFEVVWEWYFACVENVYNLEGRSYDTVADLGTKRILFGSWVRHLVARELEHENEELFQLILMRKPSIMYTAWELGDFNVEDSRSRAEYLRRLALLFNKQAQDLSGIDLAEHFFSYWFMVKAPYVDFLKSKLYPLNEYVDHLFGIDARQSGFFTAEIRQALLHDWVDRSEHLFFFAFEELFLAEIGRVNPLLRNSILGVLLDEALAGQKEKLERQSRRRQHLKRGETMNISDEAVEFGQMSILRTLLDKDREILVRSSH